MLRYPHKLKLTACVHPTARATATTQILQDKNIFFSNYIRTNVLKVSSRRPEPRMERWRRVIPDTKLG